MTRLELLSSKENLLLNDFYFNLPDELIAQFPEEKRDSSRLLVVNRKNSEVSHQKFSQLNKFLFPGDLLIFNDAKVIPARIFFTRKSGGVVEFILTKKQNERIWLALCNRTKRLQVGEILNSFQQEEVAIKILKRKGDFLEIEFNQDVTVKLLEVIGQIPLPPYIKRDYKESDKKQYQTVFAKNNGAVAAPTAGLHFTEDLLENLKDQGIDYDFLTLFVSWGTFQPVREQDLSKHQMHFEDYLLPEKVADKINKARQEKRRIIAVGTTSLRVLEATYQAGKNRGGSGTTNIFIYPPYEIKSIDGLITNFHTPYSTLLMLVASFLGYEKLMNIYQEAVKLRYRFFSYGDSMFIS